MGPKNRTLHGHAHWRHLANTLNDCVQWLRGDVPPGMAMQPVPKLLLAILLQMINQKIELNSILKPFYALKNFSFLVMIFVRMTETVLQI